MDIARKILAAPGGSKVPSVEETLPTLCNRLQHATLSSDRKSAILGLKSFSRQYRESVVEYGLRPLITALKRDYENREITKAILETLLILIIRGEGTEDLTRAFVQATRAQNGKYPCPLLLENDQFSLWIADALTQDPSSFELILVIIQDNDDFHIKLYAIQLLEAVVSARASRAKDCLLSIPTATSVLVSLLKDPRDPIRNEAILLLLAIVKDNFNIQKLVAFENTFDILFDIIQDEIGIRGSVLVQDCLSLINSLLQYNASNQKFFIETQGIPRLNELMSEPLEEAYEDDDLKDSEGNPIPIPPIHWTEQRLVNMHLALDACKALVLDDNESLAYNQEKLTQAGVLFTVLRLTFSPNVRNETRLSALLAVCDIIRGNHDLQLQLETIDVPYIDPSLPLQLQANDEPIPVILSLINWALCINSVHCFDLRVAASKCLHAYLFNNDAAKSSFLTEQMESYRDPTYYDKLFLGNDVDVSHRPTFTNVFSVLMDYDTEVKINPYRLWFAAVIITYIIEDDENDVSLDMMTNFKTGDESSGEEVLGSIQAISGSLVTTLENYDERVPIGYFMLLSIWLYENPKAVNEFLSDPSVVRSILTYLSKSTDQSVLVQGVAAFFIGIIFEFSSKESPISRVSLHGMIVQTLGKANFSLKVRQLKENPLFRNFDENIDGGGIEENGLPELYFVSQYVNLVKDNYNRISKTLIQDPNLETIKKVSYDDFRELNDKYQELESTLASERSATKQQEEALNKVIEDLDAQYNDAQANLETKTKELERLKMGHSGIEREYEQLKAKLEEIEKLKDHFEVSSKTYYKELSATKKMASTSDGSMKKLLMDLDKVTAEKKKLEEGINKMTRDLFQLQKQKQTSDNNLRAHEKEILNLNKELTKMKNDNDSKTENLRKANKELEERVRELSENLNAESKKAMLANALSKDLQTKAAIEAQNNETLVDRLRLAASTYNELKKAKLEVENQVRFLNAKVSSLEVASLELHKDNGQQRALLDSVQNGSQSKMAEFRQAFESLTLNNLALQVKQLELEDEIRTLQLDQTEEQEAYEALIVELENKIKELSLENKTLKESVSQLEDTNKQLTTSKALLQEEYQKYKQVQEDTTVSKETEISEYKEDVTRQMNLLEAKAVELEQKLQEKSEETSKAKSDLEGQLSKLSELEIEHRANLSKMEIKYDDIKHELETKVVEYNSAVDRLALQERQLSEMHEQQQDKVEHYEQRLSELKESLTLKLKEYREAKDLLKQTELELNELKMNHAKEIELMKSELEDVKSQLEVAITPESLEDIKKEIVTHYQSELSDVKLQLELKNLSYQKLEAQLSEVNSELSHLQEQYDSQSSEYKSKLEELEKLTLSKSELQLECERLLSELKKAQTESGKQQLDLEVEQLKSDLSSKDVTIQGLQQTEQELRQEVSSLLEKCMGFEQLLFEAGETHKTLEHSKQATDNELRVMKETLRQLQDAHTEEGSSTTDQKADDAAYLELVSQNEQAKQTIAAIEAELTETKANYDQVKQSLEHLKSEFLTMKQKHEAVAMELELVSESQGESLERVKRIEELEDQLLKARDELDSTKSALQCASETVSKHESDVKEFEASYLEVASLLEATKAKHDTLKLQLTTIESEHRKKLDISIAELSESKKSIAELQQKQVTHMKKIEELEGIISQLEKEIDDLKDEKISTDDIAVMKDEGISNGHHTEMGTEAEVTEQQVESTPLDSIGDFSQVKKDNSNLRIELETVSNRLEQASKEIEKLKDVIESKEQQLSEKEVAIAELEDENDSVTDMMEKLNVVKFQLEAELKGIIKQAKPELLEDKENQIVALKNDLMLKIESLGLKDVTIAKLQAELNSRVKEYEALSNEYESLKEDVVIKDEELRAFETQIADLEKTKSTNDSIVLELKSNCTTLKKDNDDLEAALASFKKEVLRLTAEFEDLTKKHELETKKASQKESLFLSLEAKCKEAESRVIQLSLDYQDKIEAIELERQLFAKEISDLDTKCSLAVKEWKAKLRDVEASNLSTISALQSDKIKLEEQLEDTLKELYELQQSHRQLILDVSELAKENSDIKAASESTLNDLKEQHVKRVSALEAEKDKLSKQLETKLQQLLEESKRLDDNTSELSMLKAALEQFKETNRTLENDFEARLKDEEELHLKAINALTSDLEASETQIEALLKQLLETNEKLTTVTGELHQLEQDLNNSRELSSVWEAKFKELETAKAKELSIVAEERDSLRDQFFSKLEAYAETSSSLKSMTESLAKVESALKASKDEHARSMQELEANGGAKINAIELERDSLVVQLKEKLEELVRTETKLSSVDQELLELRQEYDDVNNKYNSSLSELKATLEQHQQFKDEEINALKQDFKEQLEAKLQELVTIITKHNDLEASLLAELDLSVEQIETLKNAKIQLEEQLEAKRVESAEMAERYEACQEKLTTLEAELTSKIKAHEAEFATNEDKTQQILQDTQHKLQEKESKVKELTLSIENLKTDSDRKLNLVEQERTALVSELESTRAELVQLRNNVDLTSLKEELEHVKAEIRQKEESLNGKELEMQLIREEASNQVETLKADSRSLADLASSQKQEIEKLRSEISSMISNKEKDISTLEQELEQLNKAALEFRDEALQMSDNLAGLRKELEIAKENNHEVQLKERIELLEFEVADKDDNVHILEEQLKKLFESKEKLTETHQNEYQQLKQEKNDEIDVLKTQNEKLREGLLKVKQLLMNKSESESEVEQLKQALIAKDKELESLRTI